MFINGITGISSERKLVPFRRLTCFFSAKWSPCFFGGAKNRQISYVIDLNPEDLIWLQNNWEFLNCREEYWKKQLMV